MVHISYLDSDQNKYSDTDILIGRVSRAWNNISLLSFILFHGLSGMKRPIAVAVFNRLKNDTFERDVTRDVALVALQPHPDLLERLKSVLGRANREAELRNNVIHHTLARDEDGFVGVFSVNEKRTTELAGDYENYLRQAEKKGDEICGDLASLINDVSDRLGWPDILD